MRLASFITSVCLASITAEAHADQLLFSLNDAPNGQPTPYSAPLGLQFVLQVQDAAYSQPLTTFGAGVFWQDGSFGSHEFTLLNEPQFLPFTSFLTNGLDDVLFVQSFNEFGGGNGGVWREAQWGFGNPDLTGYEIQRINLIVHDLSIIPINRPPYGDGLAWNGHITWEFWGNPVPEPASAMLVVMSLLIGSRARRRGFRMRSCKCDD